MKLKIKQFTSTESNRALSNLATQPVPARVAFTLKRVMDTLNREIAAFEETRVKLCEQYGKIDEKAGRYEFGDNRGEFEKEFAELLETEIDVPIGRIKIESLGNVVMSVQELAAISWLIEDGDPIQES